MMYFLFDVMQLNGGVAQDLAENYQQCFQLPREARLAVRGLWLLDGALRRTRLLKEEERGHFSKKELFIGRDIFGG